MPWKELTEHASADKQHGLCSHRFISDGAVLQETVTEWQCLWLIWAQMLWADRNDMRINTQHDQTGNSYHSIMRALKVSFIESSLSFSPASFCCGLKFFQWLALFIPKVSSVSLWHLTQPIKPVWWRSFTVILPHSQKAWGQSWH